MTARIHSAYITVAPLSASKQHPVVLISANTLFDEPESLGSESESESKAMNLPFPSSPSQDLSQDLSSQTLDRTLPASLPGALEQAAPERGRPVGVRRRSRSLTPERPSITPLTLSAPVARTDDHPVSISAPRPFSASDILLAEHGFSQPTSHLPVRYPFDTERLIYRISYFKLTQPKRPVHQRSAIISLMLHALAVHPGIELGEWQSGSQHAFRIYAPPIRTTLHDRQVRPALRLSSARFRRELVGINAEAQALERYVSAPAPDGSAALAAPTASTTTSSSITTTSATTLAVSAMPAPSSVLGRRLSRLRVSVSSNTLEFDTTANLAEPTRTSSVNCLARVPQPVQAPKRKIFATAEDFIGGSVPRTAALYEIPILVVTPPTESQFVGPAASTSTEAGLVSEPKVGSSLATAAIVSTSLTSPIGPAGPANPTSTSTLASTSIATESTDRVIPVRHTTARSRRSGAVAEEDDTDGSSATRPAANDLENHPTSSGRNFLRKLKLFHNFTANTNLRSDVML
ncbi:uncharacterized protein BJ171DRAFT_514051 [Polychytrium aggregatum]|uniref:uncharacterized protein n=1 Tax=Polychytrium aggregatum TaxID=110093 RepID=UPI0022FF25BB|nr:uncharacterized protein BJ171DRAFT_514051 [Polychytrium aggregatum]KAI9202433.1 hypothetical protein BJ171DRAFT_514051 [Polychytrium aggregatum]